ncbi:3'-5' exonuclease [Diorhabda sublineata]|uniref:3'-5' exonuclease n=1 Tax=Diorhabda sublineata TaxID=1163346 RepID=UPI0024E1659A|nr:3'-5' exonuclease [Diorhabda sublineata]
MKLRCRISPQEREEEEKRIKSEKEKIARMKDARPFIKFTGKIIYHTELIDIALISDNLLEKASVSSDSFVIGFDMEWPFSFQTGPGKTATIQLSCDELTCYIFHVSQIKNLPKSLSELLVHPNVKLIGNNIKNDIRKLARDFKGFDGDKIVNNCLDLGVLANSILSRSERWSLEKLVDQLLDLKIDKDKKVRNSQWHVIPLSKRQKEYAATDSYASILLYQALKNREIEMNSCISSI